jgi:hypothetical protein
MIPLGYLAKKVSLKPDCLKTEQVEVIYSVSGCISPDFADYIPYWKHNGYWFFDSPEIIRDLAQTEGLNLAGHQVFYYEAYEMQCLEDGTDWENFQPEASFKTDIKIPLRKTLEGFDIVSFKSENAPECSYLSCNHMAETITVNDKCLLSSFAQAKQLLEQKRFQNCEPGPCRILAVYSLPDQPEFSYSA